MNTHQKILVNALGGKCHLCNETKDLILHHKDGNKTNNDIQNIELLCRSCHGVRHRKKHKGAKITAIVSDDVENSLRDFVRCKGDISRIVEEALEAWLNNKKGENDGDT